MVYGFASVRLASADLCKNFFRCVLVCGAIGYAMASLFVEKPDSMWVAVLWRECGWFHVCLCIYRLCMHVLSIEKMDK